MLKLQKAALKRPSLYTICMWLARWKINVNTSALTGCYQHFTEPTITLTDNLLEFRRKYTPYICQSFSLNGDKDMDRILRKHVGSRELFQKLHFLVEMTLIRMRQSLGLSCLAKKVWQNHISFSRGYLIGGRLSFLISSVKRTSFFKNTKKSKSIM